MYKRLLKAIFEFTSVDFPCGEGSKVWLLYPEINQETLPPLRTAEEMLLRWKTLHTQPAEGTVSSWLAQASGSEQAGAEVFSYALGIFNIPGISL